MFPNNRDSRHLHIPNLTVQRNEFLLDQRRPFSRSKLAQPFPDDRQRIRMNEIENGIADELFQVCCAKEPYPRRVHVKQRAISMNANAVRRKLHYYPVTLL